ncbi:hypothetical protein MCOR25_009321 [Pyricularia grisea]|nr:hypothetical protein MCOR25_009321 [Pyricularia grisea]
MPTDLTFFQSTPPVLKRSPRPGPFQYCPALPIPPASCCRLEISPSFMTSLADRLAVQ